MTSVQRHVSIVTTFQRPDLAPTTGKWRWEAFFKDDGIGLSDVMQQEEAAAASEDLLPTVLVMLDDERSVGMVTLCLDDLEDRPDLNPWLAGLYVAPEHRGKGYALRLIEALEALARGAKIGRLSLYTASAVKLYQRAGWTTTETFDHADERFSIMQKTL